MDGDLCRSCGLCCDGTLFGVVPLEPDEVEPARRHGLLVLQRDFEQPCSAHAGGDCSIYEERPWACRRFVCRLLARGGPLEPRVEAVRRVRELLEKVRASGLLPEDFEGPGVPAALALAHQELMQRLEDDFSRTPGTPAR